MVINMFRYYIFDIKNKFKNDDNLFRLLKALYTLNLKYINYGELLYNEVCRPIERYKIEEILIDYHAKKVTSKNKKGSWKSLKVTDES